MAADVLNSDYSTSYHDAKRRFREAAEAADAEILSFPVGDDTDLTIDVAIVGPDDAPTVVVSSGVHGVEGFVGSAVQLALLRRLVSGTNGVRYVLIHAVNPWGFSHRRRFNEDNVDLNRNFLLDGQAYAGTPPGYAELSSLLNPTTPPTRWEPFLLQSLWKILRVGMRKLKDSVAVGQYEYSQGLFFGGRGPSMSHQIISEHCDQWLGSAESIVHVDLHSGLGAYGKYTLLVDDESSTDRDGWYAKTFAGLEIESMGAADGKSYSANGTFTAWMSERFGDRDYRAVGAEIGTYGGLRVLTSLRNENRAHHWGQAESPIYKRAKTEIVECFCPTNAAWRKQAVDDALDIIFMAAAGCQVEASI